jgi:PmbA protein
MTILDLAQFTLEQIKKSGVDAGEVSIGEANGFSVSARMGDVETMEHHLEKSVNVTVYDQQRTGSASSSDFSVDSIVKTVEKACAIARFSQSDPFAGLAAPDRLAKKIIDCDLYHPWDITPADAIALAIECEKKAMSVDSRIVNSDGAHISTVSAYGVYANSNGFVGDYRQTDHSISCSLITEENGQMQRDDEYTSARNPLDLFSIDFIAMRASQKTLGKLNARRLKTQTCPVIFEASVAKSLLGHFISAISGGNLYRQSSFLKDGLGKMIFPNFISIHQQPHLLSAMGSCPFDQEGVETVDQYYVRDGELVNYVLGSYSARKLGLQTTGNAGGVFNLMVDAQKVTLKQLMKKMQRGLFVTELMGQGVNITTGDYSRGASGFWVENGEIQFPVEEITIAGNLKNIFSGIVGFSDDVDVRSSIRTGSILIDQITVAGE